ncbi:hypothetical protein NL676_000772 [Syzygium grande]|nr:hypothetical protein NL676_000772 [Syzygium grande]
MSTKIVNQRHRSGPCVGFFLQTSGNPFANLDQESATPPKKFFFRYNSPWSKSASSGWSAPAALSGMGGSGGQVDPTAANNTNTAAIFGILGSGIYNYNHYHHQSFAITADAILGLGAGFLWAGQGAIMTSEDGSVNDATYIGFICFMTVGTLLSLAIFPPNKVIHDDGASCTKMEYCSVLTEASEIVKLFLNWKMLLIAPAAWAGNFFCSDQFNNVNGALFNLRTRGLNNVLYWVAQILGSIGIGYVLDFSCSRRKMRGYVGIGIVALLGTAVWGGGLANQLKCSRHDLPEKLDFKDSGSDYAGRFVLYLSYGLMVATFQTPITL